MTKEQALADFMDSEAPYIIAKYGRDDKAALAEAWVMYIDRLHREGIISDRQANSWGGLF